MVRTAVIFALTTAALWAIAWNAQSYLAGTKPTQKFAATAGMPADHPSLSSAQANSINKKVLELRETISNQRELVKNNPDSITEIRKLGDLLLNYISIHPVDRDRIATEALATFSKVAKLNPEDLGALRIAAELAFNLQMFQNAESFYKKYLSIKPEDAEVRSQYASTLTFLAKYEESKQILLELIEESPDNFVVRAYLTVNYAEMGDDAKAIETGEAALKLAPSVEAGKRFGAFVASIKAAQSVKDSPAASALLKVITNNPVTGPKFAGVKREGTERLILRLKDFPISSMPEFAKEKFIKSIKEAAGGKSDSPQTVEIVDALSGEVLEAVNISG